MESEIPVELDISLEDYNYFLPQERIAQFPLENRDESKLLFCDISKKLIEHYTFLEIPKLVPANSFLIRNITKVFPARFYLTKPTGGKVEILLEHPEDANAVPQSILFNNFPQRWICTVRGKNVNPGLILTLGKNNLGINLSAEIISINKGKRDIEFSWQPSALTFAEILDKIGQIPLPQIGRAHV